ncbi:hypothetical protein [Leptospira kirschneri]|uniref:Uncharacterized protein n=1 Tax=Leptospira kirschneri str. 200802841 TaxID=1193047 RepID=A0A828Y6K3_9LEPT|nr:hypothetical protein [Leptospira kirschneri]EKO50765.1 hypothetical protein LEP1GSC131_3254 [Leptospira kirschneri str. 200802841]
MLAELSHEATNAESAKYQKNVADMIKDGQFDKAIFESVDISDEDIDGSREKIRAQYDERYNNINMSLGDKGILSDIANFAYNLLGKPSGNVKELFFNSVDSVSETAMDAKTKLERQRNLETLASNVAEGKFQGNIIQAMQDYDFKNKDGAWMNGSGQYSNVNQQWRNLSAPLSNYEKIFILQMYSLRRQEIKNMY